MKEKSLKLCMIVVAWLCLVSAATCSDEYRTITDMRGKEVQIPTHIEKVVTIDDGLIEGVMTVLGEADKIVGLGSSSLKKSSEYTFTNVSSGNYTYNNGMNPVRYLNPRFADLPLVQDSSTGINYETLASLEPDIVIVRRGSCAASWGTNEEGLSKNINSIEKLGIPTIVVNAPPCYDEPDLSRISEEIRVIGQVFDKEERADELVAYLDDCVDFIKDRTADVQENEKPRVLALGLSPQSRSAGGAGNVRGAIIAYYIEKIANAANAYTVTRYTSDTGVVSAEHVLALDPDIIILPTSSGYHPPSELCSAPYYENLRELRAVKNRTVYALAWTPSNCDASRLEYPIDLMIIAKACYPSRFNDIKINEWVLDFYSGLYGVDKETAKELRSTQWLNWAVEDNF
ncbi:MAG: corrinoid ABC transporter substrate-binding protein [Methanosaeta sp. PtaU1.Bin112]|nr:MAG: corrinoid ABC transporter substrate-binding protein [Methanosaeta sp. PtaU1.Bin112]